MLHGGLGSIDMFGPGELMPVFTKGRKVIAVDLQGHGRTTLGTRMAETVLPFLNGESNVKSSGEVKPQPVAK